MSRRIRSLLAAALACVAVALPPSAGAQQRLSLVRDAEIENTIRAYATPLFSAAGLDANAIDVHLVNDTRLNAFVANGLNLYLNTGLLMRAEHAGQVIGVIAHETGHIQGGHLLQMREQISQATIPFLLEMLATMGAMAAGGAGGRNPNDWGRTGPSGGGGPTMTERMLLQYSRQMENQADQAGVTLLDRTRQSARGLMEFLDILADQELLAIGRQDPYVRTHPITRERVEFIRNFVAQSKFSDAPVRPEFAEQHRRMRAKLMGYLEPTRTPTVYKETDNSIESRYARAFAAYRKPDFPRANALMDSLIAERPDDPWFIETKAQFKLEEGKAAEARELYARAVVLRPNEALLVQELGNAELAAGDHKAAIVTLERALRLNAADAGAWARLARAYGADNQTGMALLAQAEAAARTGRRQEAWQFADRALRALPEGTPATLRAQDIRASNEPLPR